MLKNGLAIASFLNFNDLRTYLVLGNTYDNFSTFKTRIKYLRSLA